MPKEPPDFDCRNAWQVLRLRLRDWMWPAALAIVVVIPFLGRSSGTYQIGSVTYYANVFGPLVMLSAIVFAGVRWCCIGHLRPRRADRCARCGYPTTGLDESDPASRCPECGADAAARRLPAPRSRIRAIFGGASLARWLVDLPGVLLLLVPVYVIVMIVLMIFGVIDD